MGDWYCWGSSSFLYGQFFSESHFIKSSNHYFCYYGFDSNVIFIINTVNSVLHSFGPFALMFITNFAIVFRFMRAKCNRSNSTESICHQGDSYGSHSFHYFPTSHGPDYCEHNIQLSNNTMYRNINGVLYIIEGLKFRNELLKFFVERKRQMPCDFRIQLTTQVSLASVKIEADVVTAGYNLQYFVLMES